MIEDIEEEIRKAEIRVKNAHSAVWDQEAWAKTYRQGGSNRAYENTKTERLRRVQTRAEARLNELMAYKRGYEAGKKGKE